MADAPAGESASKKQKLISTPAGMGGLGIVPGYLGVATPAINYAGAIPLSLSMKEKPKESKAKKAKKSVDGKEVGDTDSARESLPPNAVDNDGNILVTDYDVSFICLYACLGLTFWVHIDVHFVNKSNHFCSLKYRYCAVEVGSQITILGTNDSGISWRYTVLTMSGLLRYKSRRLPALLFVLSGMETRQAGK